MKKSPVTIQQWVNTLPQSPMTPITNIPTNSSPAKPHPHLHLLGRDLSTQSDDNSSYCSSVESVLESRRPDPEAVLLGLGFGPSNSVNSVTRIPHRFLQPSELLKGIDFNKFLEHQGELRNCDYRCTTVPTSPARQRPKSC
ncbi:sperm specific antigen 2-related [Holotrichia oblita]|uniref:Sperm specific antigen 2-related n=1 Tax=Holotrichia oblita TaxID=644536 RepID=A0ACB9THT1_HOLOL|nr:sperm specific antigen 2-related [Holotrichia oblita]